MTLARMIDAACRCVLCDTPMSAGCDCWLTMVCTICGVTRSAVRAEFDPPTSTEVHYPCNLHPEEQRATAPRYFDHDGKEVPL